MNFYNIVLEDLTIKIISTSPRCHWVNFFMVAGDEYWEILTH